MQLANFVSEVIRRLGTSDCVDDRDTTHNSCDQDGRSANHGRKNAVTLYGESQGAGDFDTFCR